MKSSKSVPFRGEKVTREKHFNVTISVSFRANWDLSVKLPL